MEEVLSRNSFFGTARIGKILLKIAPPVMLAQLIQSLYNVVDSIFKGKYSSNALTALTIIYPLQLIIIALAVGTGVGVNTYMARKYAQKKPEDADGAAGTGMVLAVLMWAVFALVSVLIMHPYIQLFTKIEKTTEAALIYGNIVCIGSIGVFLEGNWTKVHQSRGNMRLPMLAQIVGAVTNMVLDPLLIFGIGPFPKLGVAGAAWATVAGRGSGDDRDQGISETAKFPANEILCRQDLFLRLLVRRDAGYVYGVHSGVECDFGGLFRCGGDGAGPVL